MYRRDMYGRNEGIVLLCADHAHVLYYAGAADATSATASTSLSGDRFYQIGYEHI